MAGLHLLRICMCQRAEGCAVFLLDTAIGRGKERVPAVSLSLWLCHWLTPLPFHRASGPTVHSTYLLLRHGSPVLFSIIHDVTTLDNSRRHTRPL